MIKDNEKGLTLIELLVVIVIAFLFMGIIYSAAKLMISYQSTETTKTVMQQEMNYIITELQRVHRTNDCYTLSITPNEVVVSENCELGQKRIISDGYSYSTSQEYSDTEIYPNSENLYLESFRLKSIENKNIEVEINTIISRLR